jgi:hypothetical protein
MIFSNSIHLPANFMAKKTKDREVKQVLSGGEYQWGRDKRKG